MSRIFLSYRRVDSAGRTGRLQDALEARFGRDKVFQDIESLDAGVDFPDAVDRILATCDAVLVIIGRDWSSVEETKGRRLEQEDDLVRIEVASALKRDNVRVIPVLVDGAVMPKAEELPEDLRALVRKNAVELSDLRWDYDVGLLTASLANALGIPEDKPRSKVGRTLGIVAAITVIGLVAVLAGPRFFSGSGAMSLLEGLEKPGLEVDAANPDLIVHERILGGGYGIINDEPWRRKVLARSGEDRQEFFQPRAKVVDGRVFVLYLAKAWGVNDIFLFELDVEAGETYEVVRMPYKSGSGYYFNSPNNLVIKGSELYFSGGDNNGMRYLIGSKSAPVREDFYPAPGGSSFTFAKSPSGRYTAAANIENWAPGALESAPEDYRLAIRGSEGGSFTGIALHDRNTDENSVLFKQEYTGDWSIGTIIWSDDGEQIFFDNSGAVACIWRYDLGDRILQKIVPEHDASWPFFLRFKGRDYILYVQTEGWSSDIVESRIMIATE